ncbi:hypothetical protein GGS20DRAFT_584710 [Poronia punctata]|nr:hypothetical protein GGS20DRAFT_584710 [Poronia punctata]
MSVPKSRICIALYTRQGITSDPSIPQDTFSRYHWALFVEKGGPEKTETETHGPGTIYQVMYTDTYVNIPGSGGWKFESIPIPRRDYVNEKKEEEENCVTWIIKALEKLQGIGVVEPFYIERFMDVALRQANRWFFDFGEEEGGCVRLRVMNYLDRHL